VLLGFGGLSRDPGLLLAQQLHVDRPAVVSLQELAPFGFDFREPLDQQLSLGRIPILEGDQVAVDLRPKLLCPGCRQLDALIQGLDLLLEFLGGDIGLLASGGVVAVPLVLDPLPLDAPLGTRLKYEE
jgi:hypothetical protein